MKLSILELVTISSGSSLSESIDHTVEVAQHVEKLGYERVWFAEHHNMQHIASSAPQILIGHIAGKTGKIRVGAGGIMLPNHTPLLVSEQFGTLEALYPGRIDLGLGRAPGTDQNTAVAIRKNNLHRAGSFEADVRELQAYFETGDIMNGVHAFPGEGQNVPLWILGSSTDSAYLAAKLGLPYCFASHFAPAQLESAILIYRHNFVPSTYLDSPYVMAGINLFAAETNEEAEFFATSMYKMFLAGLINSKGPLESPGAMPDIYSSPQIRHTIEQMLLHTYCGTKETIAKEVSIFSAKFKVDELMINSPFFDHQARMKSFSIIREALHDQNQE